MQVYQKNKIDFVTEIIWQKNDDEHKVNLKQMQSKCGFDSYCKTNKIITTYGFAKLNLKEDKFSDDFKKIKKIKLKCPTSLGLFIIAASDVDKETDDVFICFRFDEKRVGYVLLYKGTILPYEGEYIGSESEVKAKICKLAIEYNIKTARIFDDVSFYNCSNFVMESGLKILVIKSFSENDKLIKASDYFLWQHKSFKNLVRSSQIKPIAFFQREHKVLLGTFAAAVLLFTSIYIKNNYYENLDNLEKIQDSVMNKTNIFINNIGVEPKTFIDVCFSDIDKYIKPINDWHISSFNCTLQGLDIRYETENGLAEEIKAAINESSLIVSDKSARLNNHFDLTKIQPTNSYKPLTEQIEILKNLAIKYGFLVKINDLSMVEINSSFSPIFLYNNNVIDNINILEISMQLDSNGFFNWTIKGKLNGK